jgi:hypothetical protein
MVRRGRLERFARGEIPLAIEKEGGFELSKILLYARPVQIKKVIKGLYSGEPIMVEEVFKASERPFESKRKTVIEEIFPKG